MRINRICLLLFAMGICSLKSEAQVSNSDTIRIGYFYYLNSEKVSPVIDKMKEDLGLAIVAKRYIDNDSIAMDFKNGKIDLFYFNSFGYIMVKDELPDLLPLLVAGDASGKPSVYNSVAITRKDNPVNSLESLIGSDQDITVSFGQPLSTSSHLVPRAYMKKIGLDPLLGNERFEQNQKNVIQSVVEGKSNLGACGLHILKREEMADEVKILWTSNDIPQGPWVTNPGSLKKVKPVIDYLKSLHVTDPESFTFIKKNWGIPVSAMFVEAEDQMYNGLRETFSSVDELKVMIDFYFLEQQSY